HPPLREHEPAFFRSRHIWSYIEHQYLPAWYDRHRGATLGIWSAGSATGGDAYSAAMLCEQFRARHASFDYRILATDTADEALRTAARGHFEASDLTVLRRQHPQWLSAYFRSRDHGF